MSSAQTADSDERPLKRLRLDSETQITSNGHKALLENLHNADVEPDGEQRSSIQAEQEREVGITAYVTPDVPGFQCVVKHRYTDFLVHEILPDGTVLHFNDSGALPRQRAARQTQNEGVDGGISASGASKEQANAKQNVDIESREDVVPKEPESVQGASTTDRAETQRAEEGKYTALENGPTSKQKRQDSFSEFPEADMTTLEQIFGEDTASRVLDLYISLASHPNRKPRDHPIVKTDCISEKSKRTEAHVAIRNIFHSKLQTETAQDQPGVIAIKAAPSRGSSGLRDQPGAVNEQGAIPKGKVGWAELGGEYLHFTLYKENKDTMEVLIIIASQLKVAAKSFQVAGTKDRRGVTVQRVAIFRQYKERLMKLNKMAKGWYIGNFEYKKHGLELGELGGNEFLLTLRDCSVPSRSDESRKLESTVKAAMESFKEHGFLNYFGLQRFGTFSTGTHTIGRQMLKGDLEGAVNSILAYPNDMLSTKQSLSHDKKVPRDDIDRADAINLWKESGNAYEAARKMPRRFQAEAAIIQFLGKKERRTGKMIQDRDFQGALMQIQRNLRLMYVHAYQSFVWNTVAGKRWEMCGSTVVEGDLVIIGEKDGAVEAVKDEVDEDGEPVFHPAADDSAPTNTDHFTRARPLSQSEAESGKYDIFDLVLPLPGYDVEYPANAIGKFYEEFMASEVGGELDPHKMHRTWRDISLSGGYRKIFAKAGRDFEWKISKYQTDLEQMVETDVEKLLRAKDSDATPFGQADVQAEEVASSRSAVVLKMQLGSSQYATMALRELTKGGALNYRPDYSAR